MIQIKRTPCKGEIKPIKVIVVQERECLVIHIYRSREEFKKDKRARYKKLVTKGIQG